MTLHEFLDRYDVPARARTRWARFLEAYAWEDVAAGLDRVWRSASTTALPSLTVVRSEIAAARNLRVERERRAGSPGGADRGSNTVAELQVMALIAALYARGARFWTLGNRWVFPGESVYPQACCEPIGDYCARCLRQGDPPKCSCGGNVLSDRDLTLGECSAAWQKVAPGEPLPQAFGSAAAALDASGTTTRAGDFNAAPAAQPAVV